MLIFLVSKQNDHDVREMLYSIGGLVAKLGLLFSEYTAFKRNETWTGVVFGVELIICIGLVIVAFPSMYERIRPNRFGFRT